MKEKKLLSLLYSFPTSSLYKISKDLPKLMENTRRESSMIHSARSTVTPVAITILAWTFDFFWTFGRTYRRGTYKWENSDHYRPWLWVDLVDQQDRSRQWSTWPAIQITLRICFVSLDFEKSVYEMSEMYILKGQTTCVKCMITSGRMDQQVRSIKVEKHHFILYVQNYWYHGCG